MSATETAAPPAVEPPVDHGDQAVRLYTYSTWLHVGPNAEDCEGVDEEAGTNECSNPLHFHAWCRLPNQFQHRDIRERALAAKARKARQLRSDGTDSHAVLEDDLDLLLRAGDDGKAGVIEELLLKDWWRDHREAAKDVRDIENEDGSKRFEHIVRDQERFTALDAMTEADRPADEYGELVEHLAAYGEAIQEAVTRIRQPRRDVLEAKDVPELVDELREQRIDHQASEEFAYVYEYQEWLVGTLRHPGGAVLFDSADALAAQPQEVIVALETTFRNLEDSERGSSGNS